MFPFLQTIRSLSNNTNILKSIQTLHKKTKFRTFYEMFDVKENTDIKIIRSKFYKLVKESKPFPDLNIPKGVAEKIITEGYNILNRHKQEYDALLRSKFSVPVSPETRTFFYVNLVVFVLFVALLSDLLVCLIRFLVNRRRYEGVDKAQEKKLRRRGDIEVFSLDRMYTIRFCKRLKRVFVR
ncbi:Molecular chaperone (DnaJ superfamily) [Trachipleistophora hominis]|uniref:Molecular chaperone (DnaJ superfamily) n=1 Tax=Trachipleistophora hominis TaxID=72359 RepID=L7JU96_TRAHO|nr:Molecular chaperone (DnaJ superfamily) [Trachipleistophora hominis]